MKNQINNSYFQETVWDLADKLHRNWRGTHPSNLPKSLHFRSLDLDHGLIEWSSIAR
jgi:hypothetical protein